MTKRFVLPLAALCATATSAVAAPPLVVIDPGHPTFAQDVGLRGKRLTEVTTNFYVASILVKLLNQQGVRVILTKPDERLLLTVKRRAEIANWAKAAVFIRLHCDEKTGSGFTVVYPGASGTAKDGTKGPTQHIINASAILAKKFHTAMADGLKGELTDNGVKTDSQTVDAAKQGALNGSIYSNVPTFLVDMVVLSNAKDEAWIMAPKNAAKMAKALDEGILALLDKS